MIKKFEEKYQVKVTITDYDSNDTALAKIRQGGHGFDIAVPSQSYMPIWIAEGLIQETNAGQMENAKNLAPEWANPEFDPGRKYSVPWQLGTIGISVNTDIYKGPLDSWSVALNPPEELKGKINVVPEKSDIIFAAVAFHGGTLCSNDKDILKKALDTLVEAKKSWVAMEYNTIDRMVAGDFAATIDWNGSAMKQRLQKPSIAYIQPKEGVALWSDNVVVLKDAKNVENAKLFQNFLMTPEAAALNSAFARYGNAITGSDAFMPEDMKAAREIVIPPELADKGRFIAACPPRVTELYTALWTEMLR